MLRSKVQLLLQLINNSLQNIFFVFLRTIYVFEFDICITILLLAIDPLCNVFIPKEYELCYKAINFVIEVIFPENAIYVDIHNNKVNIYVPSTYNEKVRIVTRTIWLKLEGVFMLN